jgi:hypothetical protein
MRRNKIEQLFGVPPDAIVNRDCFVIHKSSKKGQNSFRITKSLLESIIETSLKIHKNPTLIVTIHDDSNEYIITCSIQKTK